MPKKKSSPFSRGLLGSSKAKSEPTKIKKSRYQLKWTDSKGKRHTMNITGARSAQHHYDHYRYRSDVTNVTLKYLGDK